MLRAPGVLYIWTCKCASRHNGVQFFISHLASWLRTRCFSEPTFRPSGAPNHWKNTVFRDFPTFSRICIFFLLTLLSSNLSLLSASSLLCFSSVHIVGSLTSKLPSIKYFPEGFQKLFQLLSREVCEPMRFRFCVGISVSLSLVRFPWEKSSCAQPFSKQSFSANTFYYRKLRSAFPHEVCSHHQIVYSKRVDKTASTRSTI